MRMISRFPPSAACQVMCSAHKNHVEKYLRNCHNHDPATVIATASTAGVRPVEFTHPYSIFITLCRFENEDTNNPTPHPIVSKQANARKYGGYSCHKQASYIKGQNGANSASRDWICISSSGVANKMKQCPPAANGNSARCYPNVIDKVCIAKPAARKLRKH